MSMGTSGLAVLFAAGILCTCAGATGIRCTGAGGGWIRTEDRATDISPKSEIGSLMGGMNTDGVACSKSRRAYKNFCSGSMKWPAAIWGDSILEAGESSEPFALGAQGVANVSPAVVPLQGVPQHSANSPPQNLQSLQLVPVTGVPVDPQPPPVAGIHVVSVQSTVYAPWWLQCLCCYAWFWATSTTGYIKVQCKPLVTVIQSCVLPLLSIVLLSSLGFVFVSVISQPRILVGLTARLLGYIPRMLFSSVTQFGEMANNEMQRTAQELALSIEQSLQPAMVLNSVNSLQSSNGIILLPTNPSPGTTSVLLSGLTAFVVGKHCR